MPSRVSPSEAVRAQIDDLFADPECELGAVLEDVARLSVRLVLQAALEAEVSEFLGRSVTPAATAPVLGRVTAMAISPSSRRPARSN